MFEANQSPLTLWKDLGGGGGEGLKRFFDSQAITAFCLTIAQRATLRENGLV